MAVINPAHRNPPIATTPDEAERDKLRMTRKEAERRRRDDENEPIPGENPVDTRGESASD